MMLYTLSNLILESIHADTMTTTSVSKPRKSLAETTVTNMRCSSCKIITTSSWLSKEAGISAWQRVRFQARKCSVEKKKNHKYYCKKTKTKKNPSKPNKHTNKQNKNKQKKTKNNNSKETTKNSTLLIFPVLSERFIN